MVHEMQFDHHIETSARSGLNIRELFITLTKHIYLWHSCSQSVSKDKTVDRRLVLQLSISGKTTKDTDVNMQATLGLCQLSTLDTKELLLMNTLYT